MKFLDQKRIPYERVSIVESPPSKSELKKMLAWYDGQLTKLFNTSGLVYRELKLREKLKKMTPDEAFTLLSSEGKLVKRPFLISEKFGIVGFNEKEWEKALSNLKRSRDD